MIKVYVFHTGNVRVDRSIPLHENNPLAVTGLFRGKNKQLILPVSAYLIMHPEGNILIDTGWDTKYSTERPTEWLGLVDRISRPILKENEGIDSKLAELGLQDTDIDAVYFSHLDFDHTSGIRLVKNAKAFYAAKEEITDAKKNRIRYVDTWTGIADIEPFEYENTGIGPVGKSFDVFGDGTVILVNIPGHSHGLFAVKVTGSKNYMILANDGAYLQDSFEKQIIPGFIVDKEMAIMSLKWLIDCKNDSRCTDVLANHDPTVKEHLVTIC